MDSTSCAPCTQPFILAMNDGVTHEPIGDPAGPGLWHHKGKQLPAYIQQIAQALIRDGHDESSAIATAVSRCKAWCAGGDKVKADTRAKACAAVAEWEALKSETKAAATEMPALVTIPGVDLLAAGSWELSSGRNTFTRQDITDAIEASRCPAVGAPVIKLGHVDPRFDGQPAIGRVMNMRPDDSGMKLIGDLADMPGWFASIARAAYPRRSIEGSYGFRCQIGHEHPFVLTGLALLGVTAPGVGVLNTLPDIAALYGIQAATKSGSQSWQLEMDEGGPQVAVTEEDVRRAYYASGGTPSDWWITELQMAPTQLIVAGSDGKLFRVPFSIADDAIDFGQPEGIESYGALAACRGTGQVITYASASASRAGVSAADAGNGWVQRDGEWVYDPDNDGDDDSNAETDTDHSHFDQQGNMKPGVKIPPKPASAAADNKPYGDVKYADPKNGKYPIDTAEHARAAWAYINKEKNAGEYPMNGVTLQEVKDAIMAACKKFGIETSDSSKAASASGTYDPVTGEVTADAASPPTMDGDSKTGDYDNSSMTHGSFSGSHSHPHQAAGSQGGDESHTHSHSHGGDGNHNHAHAGASNRKGDSEVEYTDEQIASLRKSLGLSDEDEFTASAVIEAAEKLRDTADQKVAASKRHVPAGVVQVEQEVWDNLQRKVEASDRFRAKVMRDERDEIVDKAIRDGKFSAARKSHWTRLWDADPEGTREVLASLKKNVVPVDDMGTAGGNLDDEAYESEFAGLYPPGTFKRGQ